MFLRWIWFAMMTGSMLYACLTGSAAQMLPAALEGTNQAIDLTIRLGGGYLLFCGLTEIASASGMSEKIENILHPVLKRLMPHMGKASKAVAMNLSMNILGLGNAATPMGIEAMRQMEEEGAHEPRVKQDMYMLLILNATSIQLLPTTVLTLRAAAGSADPGMVIAPTLICTAISAATGTAAGLFMRKTKEKRQR